MASTALISWPLSSSTTTPPPQSQSNSITLQQISYLGRALLRPSASTSPKDIVDFVSSSDVKNVYVYAIGYEVGDLIEILNLGVKKVVVGAKVAQELISEREIGLERIVVLVEGSEGLSGLKTVLDGKEEKKSLEYLVAKKDTVGVLAEALGADVKDEAVNAFVDVSGSDVSTAQLAELQQAGLTPVLAADDVTLEYKDGVSKVPLVDVVLQSAVLDKGNGLYATTVTDERGVALGLVWSSRESVAEALKTGTGVYQSRKRGLWYKGQSSGDTQELVKISLDCDGDCLLFVVRQKGRGFCHLATASCFGEYAGLSKLEKTLLSRKESAPAGSYTARLFSDSKLTEAKIMEEAEELCQAQTKEEIAAEAADLFYFALTRCIASGVTLKDIEANLDAKNLKVKRRKGDAKPKWAEQKGIAVNGSNGTTEKKEAVKEAASVPKAPSDPAGTQDGKIQMQKIVASEATADRIADALKRPSQKSSDMIMGLVNPIIKDVRDGGDAAVLKFTHKFEKATSLTTPVLKAPFPKELMQLSPETIEAINISFSNIQRFHTAQKEDKTLSVETMPGVVCSRFSRPIERVGLYVPGGTAVLPSTALMLGVPAQVAGCKTIVLASPPRADGSISPEIVYVAHKVGAEAIVLAGGAQAVAAMAYGTENIPKVDKILGPGNQFVTAAKMIVSNDTSAGVSIDMPAGPSEVLVIADKDANPAFVASDLLSQAEHGVDSQVILIAVDLNESQLAAIDDELDRQARALPRVDIVRGAIAHSVTLVVKDIAEAMDLSNKYAPEHLILQIKDAESVVPMVENAGSVFIGAWTPESVGDYSAGVNHSLRKSLPTLPLSLQSQKLANQH